MSDATCKCLREGNDGEQWAPLSWTGDHRVATQSCTLCGFTRLVRDGGAAPFIYPSVEVEARCWPPFWLRILLGAAVIFWTLAGALTAAHADVRVAVVPDAPTSVARSATGYTLTYSSDETAVVTPWFSLPPHGQPCGKLDEEGEPYGGDPDTMFLVTTPGVLVAGRVVTWPDPIVVEAGVPVVLRLDVITPPLGGCFYAGASARPRQGVVGLAKGAAIFNDQGNDLATGGAAHAESPQDRVVTVDWWVRNGTDAPQTLSLERLGAQDGFTLDSATLQGPAKRSRIGVRWSWGDPVELAAGETIWFTVVLDRPCGLANANLRLHAETVNGDEAGTGNGVPISFCRR